MISIGFLNAENALGNAIQDFFSNAREFRVRFEVKSEEELPSLMKKFKIEYLVLSQITGKSISEWVRKEFPEVKVILFGFSNQHMKLPYQEGYYYFFIPAGNLEGIENLSWFIGNKNSIHSKVLNNRNGFDPRKLLTRKEKEVIGKLRLLNDRKGLSDELNRELDTINKHVSNSLKKTKCHKLEELLDWIDEFENKNNSDSFQVASGA